MRKCISISLPEDTKEELDRFMEARGITRSDAVREALADYLFRQKLQTLRARLLPYAEVQGVFTDEDVFRLV
ncbi:MAG TPA: ribbon-helix-helix domain-containing protein [Thermoanaerobaculia bacterium]|nr:ribbon-helix-helix domain-containing protein [Thermoanaerobaculia bacterium]